jgi:ribosomal protein L7Ae-like RNA K-turn-binding protein
VNFDPVYNLLGLAQRAGQVASGEMAAELALKKGQGRIAFLADDASERTRERSLFMTQKAGIPCYPGGSREALGIALGKAPRSLVVVTGDSFANGLRPLLDRSGIAPITGQGESDGRQDSHI